MRSKPYPLAGRLGIRQGLPIDPGRILIGATCVERITHPVVGVGGKKRLQRQHSRIVLSCRNWRAHRQERITEQNMRSRRLRWSHWIRRRQQRFQDGNRLGSCPIGEVGLAEAQRRLDSIVRRSSRRGQQGPIGIRCCIPVTNDIGLTCVSERCRRQGRRRGRHGGGRGQRGTGCQGRRDRRGWCCREL